MSLVNDGIWKGGLWVTTLWASGVWFEGGPPPPLVIDGKLIRRVKANGISTIRVSSTNTVRRVK